MNNINEIIAALALFIGGFTFIGLSFWVSYDLDKDDVKPKKHKKAKA